MKPTRPHTKSILAAAFGLTVAASQGAILIKDYTKGASSQLLIANGGAGAITFVDNAVTGGSDITFNGSPTSAGFVWRIDAGTNWALGNTVSLTGLAIPLWTNITTPETTTNNTSSGTFTFTFYSGGANNDWEGTTNLGTSDDSLIGTATASFTAGAGVDEYYVNFDTPISWVADSTVLVVHPQSTGSMRFKQGLADVPRENLGNGVDQATGLSFSLAGTVIPEPATALLGSLGLLALLRRRRS